MHTTSREAYETACDRFNAISERIQAARQILQAEIDALDDEYDAAQDALRAHEASPGVPLYTRQQPRLRPADNRGCDPPGCGRCDATYTELDGDSGHCVNSGACGRRRQARDTTKAGATS